MSNKWMLIWLYNAGCVAIGMPACKIYKQNLFTPGYFIFKWVGESDKQMFTDGIILRTGRNKYS